MEDEKMYHILYADEVRFNSLAAQIYGKVTENVTEEDQFEDLRTTTTKFDVKVANHEKKSSSNQKARQSANYKLKDALYFDILDELGINPAQPEEFSSEIVDGEIHVLTGVMKISGSSVIAPMMEMVNGILPQVKKNPMLFGAKSDKETRKQLDMVKSMTDILPSIPMPTVFRLFTTNHSVVSGPIDEVSARLNMSNMMWLFRGQLPFNWNVVGYLYPAEAPEAQEQLKSDFLGILEKSLSELIDGFIPYSNAIMFPLLILR